MKVEADVRNADDMLLIPAGCELTERHLTILESWGIADIAVAALEGMEDPADPLASLPPETLARYQAEVKSRFWQLDEGDPAAMEVFQVILRRHARRHAARPPA